jgi:hypothetical protein
MIIGETEAIMNNPHAYDDFLGFGKNRKKRKPKPRKERRINRRAQRKADRQSENTDGNNEKPQGLGEKVRTGIDVFQNLKSKFGGQDSELDDQTLAPAVPQQDYSIGMGHQEDAPVDNPPEDGKSGIQLWHVLLGVGVLAGAAALYYVTRNSDPVTPIAPVSTAA